MSLDVSLITDLPIIERGSGVFGCEDGIHREISLREMEERFPNIKISTPLKKWPTNEVYTASMPYEIDSMVQEAGLYKFLYSPEEENITEASQLIVPLAKGLEQLLQRPCS